MAGRSRNLGATAAQAGGTAQVSEGIAAPKTVRRRRSPRGRKPQNSTIGAASSASPFSGTSGTGMMAEATQGLVQYIRGRHAQGFNNQSILKEFTTTLTGWPS